MPAAAVGKSPLNPPADAKTQHLQLKQQLVRLTAATAAFAVATAAANVKQLHFVVMENPPNSLGTFVAAALAVLSIIGGREWDAIAAKHGKQRVAACLHAQSR